MSLKASAQNAARTAFNSLVTAFVKADERGGELRDKVVDLWHHDQRVAAMRARGTELWQRVVAKRAAPASAAKGSTGSNVAPAQSGPTPSAPRASAKPLGNPERPAQVYGRDSCLWTGRAKRVLEEHKVDFDYIDVTADGGDALMARLTTECKQRTVPFVFVRGKFIGGYNALSELDRLGHLEVALMTPEQLAAAPAHVRAIVVEPRPETDDD